MKAIHQSKQPHKRRIQLLLRRAGPRAAGYALLWWILTGGDQASWVIGLPVVIAATAANLMLLPAVGWRCSLTGMARFLPYFLWQSLLGSVDVAKRALNPRLPLAPFLLHYFLRLPTGSARIFFANTVSLLPGTLSAELLDDCLTVHALDEALPVRAKLQTLEARIADLFALQLLQTNSCRRILHE